MGSGFAILTICLRPHFRLPLPPTQLVHVNDHMNSPLRERVACAGPVPSAGPRADRGSCGHVRRRCAEDRFTAVRSRCRTSARGRKQLFRPARKPQSRAQPYPIRGVNQDSNDTVRLGQLGRLVCSILSGCFGAESVAALSRIRRG
jgi:hypothetical protein